VKGGFAAALAVLAVGLVAGSQSARAQEGQSPLVGRTVPEVRVKDLDGRQHSLSEYRGKIILLNFCASW
jgi:cytochrome oxidase Cu insertion factor (SCO1/SenC/PrrC family)